jgi:hypothetical protein
MFGHDKDDNDDNAKGAPMPPAPVSDDSPSDTNPSPLSSDSAPLDINSSVTDDSPPAADTPSDEPVNAELLDIKQQALQQLTPLVGHLDQTPEEKFRTTMMMIQGSDNQALINDAFSAAKQIPDEKVRAQALLDVVNEINYFTTQHQST